MDAASIPTRFPVVADLFPPALAAAVWRHARIGRARSGQQIISLGAPPSEVHFLLEGRARVAMFSVHGREVALRDLAPGAMFGELAALDGEARSTSIVALTDCRLASVAAERFRAALAETPRAALWVGKRLAGQVRALTDRVFELNTLMVRDRVYCELLRLSLAVGVADDQAVIEPAPTHAEIAARIGTHREAVTREIAYLSSKGILEQRRRRLVVHKVSAVAELVRAASGFVDVRRFGDAFNVGA